MTENAKTQKQFPARLMDTASGFCALTQSGFMQSCNTTQTDPLNQLIQVP